jgi:hypothetical protein
MCCVLTADLLTVTMLCPETPAQMSHMPHSLPAEDFGVQLPIICGWAARLRVAGLAVGAPLPLPTRTIGSQMVAQCPPVADGWWWLQQMQVHVSIEATSRIQLPLCLSGGQQHAAGLCCLKYTLQSELAAGI